MQLALINSNQMKPPIAPIGMEYIAEAAREAGYLAEILDLNWVDNWQETCSNFFQPKHFDVVGISFRNTDDCAFASQQSFLSELKELVEAVRKVTDALIVIGGVGFSAMSEFILTQCRADLGIWGDGEFAFAQLLKCLNTKETYTSIPNLIWQRNQTWIRNPPDLGSLVNLPEMRRNQVDIQRYFREGGQIGFETKRGCSGKCIYCADPVAKGNIIRCRPPHQVVAELKNLLSQGIDCFHTCDGEFNLPTEHAEKICQEIINHKLGDKIQWYAYCTPLAFSFRLAELMRQAGCQGINFGVDNGNNNMLRRLQRDFTSQDIIHAAEACKKVGMATMFDLLLASPGESKESLINTIELMKQVKPDRVGVTIGVRVYPHTELANRIERGELQQGVIRQKDNPLAPIFFHEPKVAPLIDELVNRLIDNDPRFLFFSNPKNTTKNYNYNANQVLVEYIKKGYRGAYWDILRRIMDG